MVVDKVELGLETFLGQQEFSGRIDANQFIKEQFGIKSFFPEESDYQNLDDLLSQYFTTKQETSRREYGDYQTSERLAANSIDKLIDTIGDSEFVLEPTCGRGNFLIAALRKLRKLKKAVAVEIYLPYVWETKFRVLEFFIQNPDKEAIDIEIVHEDVFVYDFARLANETSSLNTLILGNPPWITNSELSVLGSKNLPKKKSNSSLSGLEAITGKSNFDLGEAILIDLITRFQSHTGFIALLVKNIVIKNIVRSQRKEYRRIGELYKYVIDAKKEFDVSVNASLFFGRLNTTPSLTCSQIDFYNEEFEAEFGWTNDRFVSSISNYIKSSIVDGKSVLTWRSGLKHDCSKIMELSKNHGQYHNKLGEELTLESDLIYGLLKSSDLKGGTTDEVRKYTIVTQTRIGQDTNYIREKYPNTYSYLSAHEDFFAKRKSSIYKGKPRFSIFGIGDYSFKPFKVAISGLYKSTCFTLVMPNEGKPIMLDDTCYFIGFHKAEHARMAHQMLNSDIVQSFLKSIVFTDAKRAINKDVLMRIDLKNTYDQLRGSLVEEGFNIEDINSFEKEILHTGLSQISLF